MKGYRLNFVSACILVFCATQIHAKTGFINEIARLHEAGKVSEAYALAEKYRLEEEGEPLFDFYYGISAIDSGHINQGVFALERVLMLRPEDQRSRLELARGYFLLGQYDRARTEFNKVLDSNPPLAVRAKINQFLDGIRLRTTSGKTVAGMYLELGLGYDTNVNNAPSGANYASPGGIGMLSDASLAKEDSYHSYTLGANITQPLKSGFSLFADANAYYKSFEDTPEFNLRSINLQGGFIYTGVKSRWKLGMQWQDFEVGHDRYREMLAVNGEMHWKLNKQTMLTGFAQLADMNFLTNSHRDSWQQMAGVGAQHRLTGRYQPLLFATLYGGVERSRKSITAAEELVDRDIYGAFMGSQFSIMPKVSLQLTATLQESRYREDDSFFLRRREDEYRNFSIKTTWRPDKQWAISAKLNYTENDSNIPIHHYHRTQAGMNFRFDY